MSDLYDPLDPLRLLAGKIIAKIDEVDEDVRLFSQTHGERLDVLSDHVHVVLKKEVDEGRLLIVAPPKDE